MWTCHEHDLSPDYKYLDDYIDYLQNQCGLANNSIKVYSFHVRNFLNWAERNQNNTPEFLNAEMIHLYFTQKAPNQSKESTRLSSVSLRSFFRYFFLKENTSIDFSKSVPAVKVWRQAQIPKYLSPEVVDTLISSIDLSTSKGRRDHAIFLLLARLGLRAGEIVSLELKDLCWRTGKIIVRGKGNIEEHLPLLSDIGEALACYIQTDRGKGSSQHVFLRHFAPRVALSGPAAIGHIVRTVMNQAGLNIVGRGAAHSLRHSLATKMIRTGASMAEISQILRHKSLSSTAIYAKVDIEELRGVAQEWPSMRGSDENS
ncbi:MAG: tyrosine-type recombinase/integrase [Planctomycetes bacterium]|nr:tyrosine-type recombinase/integrase [Planctomycetota bacterium]